MTSEFATERDPLRSVAEILKLQEEYLRRFKEAEEALDRFRFRSALVALPVMIGLLLSVAGAVFSWIVLDSTIMVASLAGIGALLLSWVPLIINSQRRASRQEAQVEIMEGILKRLIRLASQTIEHEAVGIEQRLELEIRLAEAEAALHRRARYRDKSLGPLTRAAVEIARRTTGQP